MTHRSTRNTSHPLAREKTIAQCVLGLVLAFIVGLVVFAPLHAPDDRVVVASAGQH